MIVSQGCPRSKMIRKKFLNSVLELNSWTRAPGPGAYNKLLIVLGNPVWVTFLKNSASSKRFLGSDIKRTF